MRSLTEYEAGYIAGIAAHAYTKHNNRVVGEGHATLGMAVRTFLAPRGGFTEMDARYLAGQADVRL